MLRLCRVSEYLQCLTMYGQLVLYQCLAHDRTLQITMQHKRCVLCKCSVHNLTLQITIQQKRCVLCKCSAHNCTLQRTMQHKLAMYTHHTFRFEHCLKLTASSLGTNCLFVPPSLSHRNIESLLGINCLLVPAALSVIKTSNHCLESTACSSLPY